MRARHAADQLPQPWLSFRPRDGLAPRRRRFPLPFDRVTGRPGDWISPGAEKHTERTSVHWVLEQFQRLMAVSVCVRLWDSLPLPTKHTKIGHFSVLHENTLCAAQAIFLLCRHDCAISRIGF